MSVSSVTPFPLVWDNTMRAAFVRCPTYWRRAYLEGWASPIPSIHLHAGGAFAFGVEQTRKAFYERSLPVDDAVASGAAGIITAFGDAEVPDTGSGANKSPDRLLEGLVSYFDQYPLSDDPLKPLALPDGKRALEFTFSLPIPDVLHPATGDPLIYAGRFDMLAERDGVLFIVDEKTASQLGASWVSQWTLDSQFTGYCWAARQFGYPVAGAIIRGISFLKSSIGHAQAIIYRPEWTVERWYKQLCRDLRRAIACWSEDEFDLALDKSACGSYGGCTFVRVCDSPDPERWLEADFVKRKWDPLNKD